MGSALAGQLASCTDLHVWDLNTKACERFKASGATIALTAADVARSCQLIFLCLPRSSDVKNLIFQTDGFLDALTSGTVIIDQTSGIPEQTRSIAEELQNMGVYMMDAPVAGGVPAAQAGRITMMVSGPSVAYEKAFAVLQKISPTIIRCGNQVGNGQAIKIINNTMNASCRIALFETMAMGHKMGLPCTQLAEAINSSHACSRLSQVTLTAFLQGKPSSNFALPLMVKDVHQAILLANTTQTPLPIASLSQAILEIATNTVGPASTLEDVAGVIASMAGTQLATSNEAESSTISENHKITPAQSRVVGYVGSVEASQVDKYKNLGQLVHVYDSDKTEAFNRMSNSIIVDTDLVSLAQACDLIIIGPSVNDTEILVGIDGLVGGLSPGTIVIDHAIRDPETSRQLAAELQGRGVTLLDAPLCKRIENSDTDVFMAVIGGALESYQAVKQILKNASIESIYMGQSGAGNATKLLLTSLETCHQLITMEAASLALGIELDIQDLANVIMKGTGWSKAFELMLVDHRHNKAQISIDLEQTVHQLSLVSTLAFDVQAPMLISNTARIILMEIKNQSEDIANMDDLMQKYLQRAGITQEEHYW